MSQLEILANFGARQQVVGRSEMVDYEGWMREQFLRLHCPLILYGSWPQLVDPETVRAWGLDGSVSLPRVTRHCQRAECHEVLCFFERFEKAMRTRAQNGMSPATYEAWEDLGALLWGALKVAWNHMNTDYDDGKMHFVFGALFLGGAAVDRQEIRDRPSGHIIVKYMRLGFEGGPEVRLARQRLEGHELDAMAMALTSRGWHRPRGRRPRAS